MPKFAWASWEYDSDHCPEELHTQKTEVDKLNKWLDSTPYLHRTTQVFQYDRNGAMSVALALGMLIRDVSLAQFGLNDPDDEPDTTAPEYIGDSVVPYSILEERIFPFCTDITTAIGQQPRAPRTSARKPVAAKSKEIQDSVLPVVEKQGGASKRRRAGTAESGKVNRAPTVKRKRS